MEKKYLHIMTNEKFINNFVNFINKNFNKEEHTFLIIDGASEKELAIPKSKNVLKIISKGQNIKNNVIRKLLYLLQLPLLFIILFQQCKRHEKIFFHGMNSSRFTLFLYLFSNFLKKSYWDIWGADLYCYKKRDNSILRNKIWYKVEDYVKGNFYGYTTQIKGDYELAKLWYKAKGKFFYSFMYPSNMYKEINLECSKNSNGYLNIQIGNSADPSNNHLEILEKLKKSKNLKIYCPLSYGDSKYAKYIEDKGKEIFGNDFIPMFDFLEYNEYLKFLSTIDIAIFAHNRQQAVGNIMSLLSLKKTVYIKESVTTFEMLDDLGIKIKSFSKFNGLEVFSDDILEKNKEIIKKYFSEDKLIKDLEYIFND